MFIIGLTGKAGSGKDTAAIALSRQLGFQRHALAGPIKESLNTMFGWTPDKWIDREWKERPLDGLEISPRTLAQTLGTEWGRELRDDFWIALLEYRLGQSDATRVVVTDVRFDNEASWIQQRGGWIINITRLGIESVEAHSSEDGLHPSFIDFEIPNDRSITHLEDRTVREVEFKLLADGLL